MIANHPNPQVANATPASGNTPPQVILKAVEPYSLLTDFDIALFKSGKHYKLYEKLGSHVVQHQGVTGTYFAVWAPNAKYVSVMGGTAARTRSWCVGISRAFGRAL